MNRKSKWQEHINVYTNFLTPYNFSCYLLMLSKSHYLIALSYIAGKLKLDKNTDFCISTESIYRFVYTSPVAAKLKLYSYLPSKRFKRQERGKRRQRIMI